jgi:catechol 2,3-dioxygenase-like lactoylglutathione lyase family enzyme
MASINGSVDGFDFDHISFAVHDALAWGLRLRRELGAVPIAGEELPEFRYLLMHLGDAEGGRRLELIEPVGSEGFVSRFLQRRGEGPHHLTFTVPDLSASVAVLGELGQTALAVDYAQRAWQEAFLGPDAVHGVVLQLAQTNRGFPSPSALCRSMDRHPESFPSNRGARRPHWWVDVWAAEPLRTAKLGRVFLGTSDPTFSERLFRDVLGAVPTGDLKHREYQWSRATLKVETTGDVGVRGVEVVGGPPGGITIGAAHLGSWT